MLTTEDRSAFERQWTAQTKPAEPAAKTGADLKDLFHKPDDPNLDVRKSSITSLLRWARARQRDSVKEFKGEDLVYQTMYWNGYQRAIQEILEMEHQ